jgi:uncharacterized membrane protein YeiH
LQNYFTTFIEFAGTFAFAISGIRLASGKQIDWFGAYLVGLATAIGGGTLRDLLLDVTPFWMMDGKYFLITLIALLTTLVFKERIFRWSNTLFLFDAIGLGLFTIVGISKSMAVGLPIWVCIVMGTITGSVGGVIRDILLNEVPLLLRKDIYALACVAGGLVYFGCLYLQFSTSLTELIAASVVIFIRIIALKFHIHLPVLNEITPKANG